MKLSAIEDSKLLELYNVERMSFGQIVKWLKENYSINVSRQGVKLRLEKIPGFEARNQTDSHIAYWNKKRNAKSQSIDDLIDVYKTTDYSIENIALITGIEPSTLYRQFLDHPDFEPRINSKKSKEDFVLDAVRKGQYNIREISERFQITEEDIIRICKVYRIDTTRLLELT